MERVQEDGAEPMLHKKAQARHVLDTENTKRPKEPPSLWWVHGGLILSQLCWGSAAVTNRIGLDGLSPILFAFVRESCAGPLLLLLAGYFEHGGCCPPFPSRRDAAPLILAGCSIFMDQFCSLTGVKLADSSSLSAWQPSQLVFTLGMAICLGWEQLNIGKFMGIVFTIIGALMLAVLDSGGSSEHGDHKLVGQLFFLCNCLASSFYVICTKKALRSQLQPIAVTAWSYMVAAVLMFFANLMIASSDRLMVFFCDDCDTSSSHFYVPPSAIWAIVYSVIFQSCVGYMVQTWCNQYADASVVSQYAAVQPIISVSISCIMIAMHVNPHNALSLPGWNMLGAPLILAGLFVVVRSTTGSPPQEPSGSPNL